MHVALSRLQNTKLSLLFFMSLPLTICSTFVCSAPSVIPLSPQFTTFCVEDEQRARAKNVITVGPLLFY